MFTALKSLFYLSHRSRGKKSPMLFLESLEERAVPAVTYTWNPTVNDGALSNGVQYSLWTNPNNWTWSNAGPCTQCPGTGFGQGVQQGTQNDIVIIPSTTNQVELINPSQQSNITIGQLSITGTAKTPEILDCTSNTRQTTLIVQNGGGTLTNAVINGLVSDPIVNANIDGGNNIQGMDVCFGSPTGTVGTTTISGGKTATTTFNMSYVPGNEDQLALGNYSGFTHTYQKAN
jgi:hypothetical protein